MSVLTPAFWQAFRFWSKVDFSGECWNWKAYTMRSGYGQFGVRKGRLAYAHRIAYLRLRGAIPDGLQIDHLCRNRRCVNPAHLEPVPQSVNIARGISQAVILAGRAGKTHCPAGHEYTPENTYRRRDGKSKCCRACAVEQTRSWRANRRKNGR